MSWVRPLLIRASGPNHLFGRRARKGSNIGTSSITRTMTTKTSCRQSRGATKLWITRTSCDTETIMTVFVTWQIVWCLCNNRRMFEVKVSVASASLLCATSADSSKQGRALWLFVTCVLRCIGGSEQRWSRLANANAAASASATHLVISFSLRYVESITADNDHEFNEQSLRRAQVWCCPTTGWNSITRSNTN